MAPQGEPPKSADQWLWLLTSLKVLSPASATCTLEAEPLSLPLELLSLLLLPPPPELDAVVQSEAPLALEPLSIISVEAWVQSPPVLDAADESQVNRSSLEVSAWSLLPQELPPELWLDESAWLEPPEP